MPPRNVARLVWILVSAAAVLVLSACGRLPFTKPDYGRGKETRIAREVHIDPKSGTQDLVFNMTQVAQARLLNGDPQRALEAAERALKADPKAAEAQSLAGLSLDALGRRAEAGPHHRRAAELAPERGALLNNYGIWLCSNGQASASLDWFHRAAQSAAYDTPDAALANAAACALQAGQGDLARSDARRALDLAPTNALALTTLARVEFAAGHGLEARAFVQRRLAAGPADADVLLLASQIEQSLGDTAAASRYVQRMKAEFPRDSDAAGEGGQR